MARMLWKGTWILGLGVAAGLVCWWWRGDALAPGRYTGYAMPWLVLALLPAAIAALVGGRRALAVLLVGCAAAIAGVQAPRLRPARAPAAGEGARVVVMSWNTWSENRDADRIAAVIVGQRPDLVLLQELFPDVFASVALRVRELDPRFTYHEYDRELLQGVLSRHPLEPRPSRDDAGQAQHVLVRAPGGVLDVFNVHVQRSGGWRHRLEQLTRLLAEVDRVDGPVVVAGDFNSPDASEPYRLVRRHLSNAHEEAAGGFGFTFPTPAVRLGGLVPVPSLIRIDHVFHDGRLAARRAATLDDDGGSDHRPVVAELEVLAEHRRPSPREARVYRP